MRKRKNNSAVTWVLIAANIAVFAAEELLGGSENTNVLIRMGALYPPLVKSGGYWRLFTAMFLHIGLLHIISNMISLYIFGGYMEQIIGHVRYIILYLASGVSGNLLTIMIASDDNSYISAGASGAIFGMIGGLAALAVFRRNEVRGMSPLRVILVLLLMLAPGFSDGNVNIAAHAGGALGGFAAMSVMAPSMRTGKSRR